MSREKIAIGHPAPDFTLQAADGGMVKLSDFRGKRVVLYFYPKDDTPGCTKEACSFRDSFAQLGRAQTVVLGVSRDSVPSHSRFAEKFRLPFPLLSDPDASVCKAYGVYKQKSMYGRTYWGIERTTFVIDAQGRVAAIFPKVNVDGHTQAVLEALPPAPSGGRQAARGPNAATASARRRRTAKSRSG